MSRLYAARRLTPAILALGGSDHAHRSRLGQSKSRTEASKGVKNTHKPEHWEG